MIPALLLQRLTGAAMIAAGLAIAVVFGGGLIIYLWTEIAAMLRGAGRPAGMMSALLMGPIVGVAPALLGLVLVRMGWRRAAGAAAEGPDDEA